jgi:hypothetical protein
MGKTSYPGQLDSDVELPRVNDNITEIGGEAINSLRDAVFSIEEAIGINPQGNLADFVTRINKVIDNDGVIKSSALSQKGLVTLPIANNQIDSNAGIEESKLSLDHTTSSLYDSIISNDEDIEAIRESFNAFMSRTIKHFSGLSDRHDGYHIDLQNPIRSSENLETAVNIINNAFTAHESSGNAHHAFNITINDEFKNFSADNVQDALVELDNVGTGRLEKHQDLLHVNSISLNRKGEHGGQGNLRETTAATTIFETEISKATNILQIMRPNVARVTSKNIDLRGLTVGESSVLRIAAGGVNRDYVDVDFTSIIPVIDLDEVVSAINQTAHGCENHYPISAYNTGGKLTIAHTIPGEEFTIQILDTVQFSAATALGFGDVTSTTFSWSEDNHAVYAGGHRIEDFKVILKTHYSHETKPLNLISPGVGNLADYGLTVGDAGRVICNITNHSNTPNDNGTHYIIAFPNDESFSLSADIQNGEFDIEIVADSVNFINSANGEIYDVFISNYSDGYGAVSVENRASYGVISGVDIKALSKNFPTQDVEWEVTESNNIQLFEGGFGGVTEEIPTGFVGDIKVYAPDNMNSALFSVTGAPGNAKRTIDVNAFIDDNDRFYVSSIHYAGNHGLYTLKYPVDKRRMGGSVESHTEDSLDKMKFEEALDGLRNNGIIHGLNVVSYDTNTIKVRGGKALVNGKIIEVETQDVYVDQFGAATRLLLLDSGGKFVTKSEFDSGYSMSELIDGDAYGDNRGVALIAEFETNGSEIDGYILDRRLVIGNIDKKLVNVEESLNNKITQIQNVVNGSMWGHTIVQSSGTDDGYLAGIEVDANNGFSYIPSQVGWWDQDSTSARGFIGGRTIITDRRFEFSGQDTTATTIFKATGLTHLNVFVEAIYTGHNGGPFGASGTAYIDVGIAVETGMSNITVNEEYATVKTLVAGVLPGDEIVERYVVSIPTAKLSLSDNVMFNVVPRVRVLNANYIDGGTGTDPEPTIRFDHIRIVSSSYSIAGVINEEDGSNAALAATIGEVL